MKRGLAAVLLLAAPAVQAQDLDSYRHLPVSPGAWTYRPIDGGSEARFGESLIVRCLGATGQVAISRLGVPPAPMTIVTSSTSRGLAPGQLLAARDPLLDAIAFSRGRFIVAQGSLAPILVVPAWPEIARSIEDCRN